MEILNKNVLVYIRGFNVIKGYVTDIGEDWLVLKSLPGDYIIDGTIFINKLKILNVEENTNKNFNIIINSKIKTLITKYQFNLENWTSLLFQLESFNRLIMISLHKGNEGIVGLIKKINEKNVILRLLSPDGVWENDFKCDFNKIRVIEIDSDYLNSLEILIDFKLV